MSPFVLAIAAVFAVVQAPAWSPQAKPVAATGTAVVGGVVVSATEPAKPVRRALVTLSGRGELSRGAVTDDEGRFAIGFLPAGTYTLTVSKPAWLSTAFGATAPGRPGTPFVVREGETTVNLRIALTRGAAISGTVRDHSGEGAEGAQVFAVRADLARGPRAAGAQSVETVIADDTGGYRFFGLAPGAYIIGAVSGVIGSGGVSSPSREQIDADLRALQQSTAAGAAPTSAAAGPPSATDRFSYAPIYHPSATSAAQAGTVVIEAGEDRRGADIFLKLAPLAVIEGQVISADGRPTQGVVLGIKAAGPTLPAGVGGPPSPSVGSNGHFRYVNVSPGTWTITARTSPRDISIHLDPVEAQHRAILPAGVFYWAAATVDVNGGSLTTALRLRPGVTMTGRVLLDGATPQPPSLAQVRLSMEPDPAWAATALFPDALPALGSPENDGSFKLRGLTPGVWVLTAVVPGATGPGGWWLRSAIANGKDLLDAPIDISERDLANVDVTLSNRHTEISGTLLGTAGKPASDLTVVVMPQDRALWVSTRRVQHTRPASDGRFSFGDLPPGTYLLAAVTDVPADNWRTEAFLAAVASAGVTVTIGEGEKKTQDLRVK